MLDPLKQSLHNAVSDLSQQIRNLRIQMWKTKLRQSFDIYKHGDAAFAWLRSKPHVPIMAVKNQHDQVVTDPHEVLEAVQSAWQQLFNNNKQLSWESFLAETHDCIPRTECDLPPLTGQILRQKILKTKASRAVALDGWRIPELQALPCAFFDLVASVFNAVEEGADWPDACLRGTVTTIP